MSDDNELSRRTSKVYISRSESDSPPEKLDTHNENGASTFLRNFGEQLKTSIDDRTSINDKKKKAVPQKLPLINPLFEKVSSDEEDLQEGNATKINSKDEDEEVVMDVVESVIDDVVKKKELSSAVENSNHYPLLDTVRLKIFGTKTFVVPEIIFQLVFSEDTPCRLLESKDKVHDHFKKTDFESIFENRELWKEYTFFGKQTEGIVSYLYFKAEEVNITIKVFKKGDEAVWVEISKGLENFPGCIQFKVKDEKELAKFLIEFSAACGSKYCCYKFSHQLENSDSYDIKFAVSFNEDCRHQLVIIKALLPLTNHNITPPKGEPDLTDKIIMDVKNKWTQGTTNYTLAKDLETFPWSDAVIDAYFKLITQKKGILNSYAFPCQFFNQKVGLEIVENVFCFDLLFIPILVKTHRALIVVKPTCGQMDFYDSCMILSNDDQREVVLTYVIERLAEMYQRHFITKILSEYYPDPNEYEIFIADNMPQNNDPDQSSLHILATAEFLSRGRESFAFNNNHVNYLKARILLELMGNCLLANNIEIVPPDIVDSTSKEDFDKKRETLRQNLRMDDEAMIIHVRKVFEDSLKKLRKKIPEEWRKRFNVLFRGERPSNEWYKIMSQEIVKPELKLFTRSYSDPITYRINPSSGCTPKDLSCFQFVGLFIAKAIYDVQELDLFFTRSFYKHILYKTVNYTDMESEDHLFFQGLVFILEHGVEKLTYKLTLSVEIQDGKIIDLVENGRDVQVTKENVNTYVELSSQVRITSAISKQLEAFLKGFYEIIPLNSILMFNEQELEFLISGLPTVDIDELRDNTEYHKYRPDSLQIQWLWKALRSFDQLNRSKFLQFVTGTSYVPPRGFAFLQGKNGDQKFQIYRNYCSTDQLPTSYICFNQLNLPAYETYNKLCCKIFEAIK